MRISQAIFPHPSRNNFTIPFIPQNIIHDAYQKSPLIVQEKKCTTSKPSLIPASRVQIKRTPDYLPPRASPRAYQLPPPPRDAPRRTLVRFIIRPGFFLRSRPLISQRPHECAARRQSGSRRHAPVVGYIASAARSKMNFCRCKLLREMRARARASGMVEQGFFVSTEVGFIC